MIKSMGIRLSVVALLLAIVMGLQFGCAKQSEEPPAEEPQQLSTAAPEEQKLETVGLEKKAAELAELRQETEALLASLKEKEVRLNDREAELDKVQKELRAREDKLDADQRAVSNMRTANYVILFAGLGLLALAIVLLVKAGKKKSDGEKIGVSDKSGGEKTEKEPPKEKPRRGRPRKSKPPDKKE